MGVSFILHVSVVVSLLDLREFLKFYNLGWELGYHIRFVFCFDLLYSLCVVMCEGLLLESAYAHDLNSE